MSRKKVGEDYNKMGNAQTTPMTREELRRARQHQSVPEDVIEDIALKVWREFGHIQRNSPDEDKWEVKYRLDVDVQQPINETICRVISDRVASEYIGGDYPYELASITLGQDDDGHYVICLFQEEGIVVSVDEEYDDEDEISFDSEVTAPYYPDDIHTIDPSAVSV